MDCSSGLRPCVNLGSFSADCCVEGLMLRSIARCWLITWRRGCGSVCHFGSSVPRTYSRCSGGRLSRNCSRCRTASFSSGDNRFHFSRFCLICSCRAGGSCLNCALFSPAVRAPLRRNLPTRFLARLPFAHSLPVLRRGGLRQKPHQQRDNWSELCEASPHDHSAVNRCSPSASNQTSGSLEPSPERVAKAHPCSSRHRNLPARRDL